MLSSPARQPSLLSALDHSERGAADAFELGEAKPELHQRRANGAGAGDRPLEGKRKQRPDERPLTGRPARAAGGGGDDGWLSKVILSGKDRRSFLLLILLCA